MARVVAVVTACLLALSVAGTVFAKAPGVSVEIIVDVPNEAASTFTVVGDALCPSGTAENFFERFAGTFPQGRSFHGYKELTCDDSSGSFSITYDAATVGEEPPQDQGGWKLYGGTGEWAGCTGGGNLVGVYYDGGITDHYTGWVSCP
jgi:hypothetical protein